MKGKFYSMTNNRKIANSIFNTLRKEGIIVTGVEFLDGYFIFAMGEDSVVHFHVKGLKNWKFGIWINMDYEKQTIKCFAQHEQFIDKFKPSDSLFLETVSRYSLCSLIENKDNARWVYYDIIKMIKHIKNNPRITRLLSVSDIFCNCVIYGLTNSGLRLPRTLKISGASILTLSSVSCRRPSNTGICSS